MVDEEIDREMDGEIDGDGDGDVDEEGSVVLEEEVGDEGEARWKTKRVP